ncbi:MAG: glucosamine-6-phosphate deaminase [Spirochaetota bacterium]|nr:glucosamine-6-phosphate deaminase [Spirochaetota bacterium]
MDVKIFDTTEESGQAAARLGAEAIKDAIRQKGEAAVILATGNSQLKMIENLTSFKDIDWSKVTCFHLDEYVGISDRHPASFRKYLKEKFADRVGPLKDFIYVNGDADDVERECDRLGRIISRYTIDAAFIGIGENAHIAFNDPPADFDTEKPYIIVTLDETCRRQQIGEGWFASIEDVPERAVSMSIRQIMKSKIIICTVPERRKARAVQLTMEKEVSPEYPATILREHPQCTLFLDAESSSLLEHS